ncbi:MAG: hypothetical protein Q9227_003128 [Pyrenula ochraceoflavens]
MDQRIVGVLGGGQLGRMLVEAANDLNIELAVLDAPNAPAKQVSSSLKHVDGSFKNSEDVRKLAKVSHLLTMEIEHVDTQILEDISSQISTQPDYTTVRTIQDKYRQKEHLEGNQVATAESIALNVASEHHLSQIGKQFGFPFMLKSRTEAYDGRGNYPVKSDADFTNALNVLKGRPLYAEKWARFKMELAVMVVKTSEPANVNEWEESTLAFPVVETIHEDSICKLVYAPARNTTPCSRQRAQQLARRAVASFKGKGVFGVEMFLLPDDSLLINEIAPRPHNSGHYTIEACHMSQYQAHLHAILDKPIPKGATDFRTANAKSVMLNILGGEEPKSHLEVGAEAEKVAGATIHLYGKGEARPGRKMGHITLVGTSFPELESRVQPLVDCVDKIRARRLKLPDPTLQPLHAVSIASKKPGKPICVTMGSDTDLPTLEPGLKLLRDWGIEFETTITSAHRTPKRMLEFGEEAAERGIKVFIAAAGGAAHLPGMLASVTPLPVIGVPVRGSQLGGTDSLLSIVQMPRGVPVATVGINNSPNAAILAASILGVSDEDIRQKVLTHKKEMEDSNLDKAEKLESMGWEEYLLGMKSA